MNTSSVINNRSCKETQLFGIQVLSDDVETVQRYTTLVYYCLLFPFSITLPSFIIFLIIKFKHLRDTTFILALQVVIIDLVNILVFTPIAISTTVSGHWMLGGSMCMISGAVYTFIYLLRNWLMFIFVFDRFCTVFAPFRYNRSRKKSVLTLWLIALVLSTMCIAPPLIMGCFGFNRVLWICVSAQIESCPHYLFCNSYLMIIIGIGELTGSCIPFIMYILLFIKAKKVRNQITPVENTQVDGEQRKRDRRANLTFFAIFLALFGFTFPPLLAYAISEVILPTFGIKPIESLILVSYALQELHLLLPIVDSVVILRNPEMRQAVQELKNRLLNRSID